MSKLDRRHSPRLARGGQGTCDPRRMCRLRAPTAVLLRLRRDGPERALEGIGGVTAGDQVCLIDDHGRDRADAGLVPLAFQGTDVVGEAA